MSALRALVVPIDLGGSPHRWALQPPRRPSTSPSVVSALIDHYGRERRRTPDQTLEVAFFHGGLPTDDQLAQTGSHPVRLACLPTDLPPAALPRLEAAGLRTVELDIATADTPVRRAVGRRAARAALALQARGLRDRGLRVGVVLSPGLPGSDHAAAVADAEWLAAEVRPHFVRLQPALAWAGSDAEGWVAAGRWTPMDLPQAVTTLHAMIGRLEAAGIELARVGLQPGPDLPGRVVAGPVHPNLRALVEYRRFRARIRAALTHAPRARGATVRVHPADLSWARGPANATVRALRVEFGVPELRVEPDPEIPRGRVAWHSGGGPAPGPEDPGEPQSTP